MKIDNQNDEREFLLVRYTNIIGAIIVFVLLLIGIFL